MRSKLALALLLLFYGRALFSQSDLPAEYSGFIPNDFVVVKQCKGDLNLDQLDDMILVLGQKGEDSLSNVENQIKRKTLILIRKDKNTFKLIAQNENAVYYYNYDLNFKEALVDVSIQNGTFSIGHYGGFNTRWSRTSVFKYDPKLKNWYLIKDEFSSFQSVEPEGSEKETILTPKNFGKISFSEFDIYKDVKLK